MDASASPADSAGAKSFQDTFWSILTSRTGLRPTAVGRITVRHHLAERLGGAPDAYLHHLSTCSDQDDEMQFWMHHLAIQESSFYRGAQEWNEWRTHLFPLLAPKGPAGNHRLRAASVGTAHGEEALTLALELIEAGWPEDSFEIDAFDIQPAFVSILQNGGPWSDRAVQAIPAPIRSRAFTHRASGWFCMPSPVNRIRPQVLNLAATRGRLPRSEYDIILCRNVIIYFEQTLAEDVLRNLHAHVRPGGVLVVGPAEGQLALNAGLPPLALPHLLVFRQSGTQGPEPPSERIEAIASLEVPRDSSPRIAAMRHLLPEVLSSLGDGDRSHFARILRTVLPLLDGLADVEVILAEDGITVGIVRMLLSSLPAPEES